MGMCRKCAKMGGMLFLLFGIIFLITNLTTWDFWGITWYTVLFLLLGIGKLGHSKCDDCHAQSGKKK